MRVEGCESCHSPHGSTNAKLLKRPVVFTMCIRVPQWSRQRSDARTTAYRFKAVLITCWTRAIKSAPLATCGFMARTAIRTSCDETPLSSQPPCFRVLRLDAQQTVAPTTDPVGVDERRKSRKLQRGPKLGVRLSPQRCRRQPRRVSKPGELRQRRAPAGQ